MRYKRDPSHFEAVLTCLREGPPVALKMMEKTGLRALNRELNFYGLREIAKQAPAVAILGWASNLLLLSLLLLMLLLLLLMLLFLMSSCC